MVTTRAQMSKQISKPGRKKKPKIPKKYLAGAKNKSAKAAEIKRTAAAYKRGEKIDLKAISKFRASQNVKNKKKKKR